MKSILVSLISEQTIPNILVAAHYKSDNMWFISTQKMEDDRKTESIENTLKLKGLLPSIENIRKIVVDQDSLTDCMNKIEGLVEEIGEVEYIVNITGGNKIMAFATYEIFRGIGQKVIINYMPQGKNEIVQIFPRKEPLKVFEIKERLNLEEYLMSYGFNIQNKDSFSVIKTSAFSRRDRSIWILDNYELLKELLRFFYKNIKESRKKKQHHFSGTFHRAFTKVEKEMLDRYNFDVKDRILIKDITKDEMVYLTGGWFEEYVFNEVYSLMQDGVVDDAMIGLQIENLNEVSNELDIAFVRRNFFYHIECKTLGEGAEERDIINEEIYKKGVLSTLLGKGERRAIICTTYSQIKEAQSKRARDYGVEIFTLEQVMDLGNILRERFK